MWSMSPARRIEYVILHAVRHPHERNALVLHDAANVAIEPDRFLKPEAVQDLLDVRRHP